MPDGAGEPACGELFGFATQLTWLDDSVSRRFVLLPDGSQQILPEQRRRTSHCLGEPVPRQWPRPNSGAEAVLAESLPGQLSRSRQIARAREGWRAIVVEIQAVTRTWPDHSLIRNRTAVFVSVACSASLRRANWITTAAGDSLANVMAEALDRLADPSDQRSAATGQQLKGRHRVALSRFAAGIFLHEAIGHGCEFRRRQQVVKSDDSGLRITAHTSDHDDLGFAPRELILSVAKAPDLIDPAGFWVCSPHDPRPRVRFTDLRTCYDRPADPASDFTGILVHQITAASFSGNRVTMDFCHAVLYTDGKRIGSVRPGRLTATEHDLVEVKPVGDVQMISGACSVGASLVPVRVSAPACVLEVEIAAVD